ncbi:hypothetical protein G6F57_009476 [Rhizopus arrhizus]|uniref:Xylanolytic transcriptional activator regulatory domain-containing protein n=1 Tax=Rhizopus oryzae TaxID=64495 RepID=A0A9P7BLH1_RHIOR|nr:hypothetical protein G6F23_004969 [Rhizopus arrhizus]KAG1415308.1 hypothetical protein G6F58_006544 [Rhizopus delemar]KAG0760835.1 hypothetical protein G6F24_008016 [Rhizopus arrhizus]KAG0781707.1 hypothetical protein G6F22_009445 [Rhizopus arrhizus]KAG0789351.1 hypothetical protein G6F21_006572 [Rhizopus arrhizus]
MGIACEYAESKKRGPRKGYVQTLEEKLTELEKRLMSTENLSRSASPNNILSTSIYPSDSGDDLPPLPIVDHLVDMFFKHINAFIPFVHRASLKKSIHNGTVSRPLLYSVLAASARFSDHPSVRTNPPYSACERFANKALSLVDARTLQPTVANIQFWGIMSCVEYGRASGSMSWVYGGLAMRFCQELGYHKEEVLSAPILAEDGSVDAVAIAVRRRVFWSCLLLDKLASAGTHRPQCLERSDRDAHPTNVAETILLRDPDLHTDIHGKPITEDSLLNIVKYYLDCVERFGEVNKYMNKNNSNKQNVNGTIMWPPIAEYRNLDMQLRSWQENLPEKFQFTQKNLEHHQRFASFQHLSIWLNCHAVWCSSMMILHRGSLAYIDQLHHGSDDLARRIKTSIETCHMCVDAAMGIFGAMKDLCGSSILPYIGYSAYVFATLLMTSAFSRTREDREKSKRGLKILYELIEGLSPYWLACENLANATKELLFTHEKLYENTDRNNYSQGEKPNHSISSMLSQDPQSLAQSSMSYQSNFYMPASTTATQPSESNSSSLYSQQPQTAFNYYRNDINFNSAEFLFDTELFGQVILDSRSNFSHAPLLPGQQQANFNHPTQQQNPNTYTGM